MEYTLKAIRDYFEMDAKDFTREWKQLTPWDRAQIRQGLNDGTETY